MSKKEAEFALKSFEHCKENLRLFTEQFLSLQITDPLSIKKLCMFHDEIQKVFAKYEEIESSLSPEDLTVHSSFRIQCCVLLLEMQEAIEQNSKYKTHVSSFEIPALSNNYDNIKLPEITLPSFDGDFSVWYQFLKLNYLALLFKLRNFLFHL